MTTTLESVPTAPGRLPLLGHLGQLVTRRLQFVRSLGTHGGLVRIYFGNRPVFAVTDPGLLRELLVEHGRAFDKGSIFDKGKAFLGDGLIVSAGDLHRRQRRLIQPGFAPTRIERYVPAMRDAAARLTATWRPGVPVVLDEAMMGLAFDTIMSTMFPVGVPPETGQRIRRALPLLIEGSLVRAFLPDGVERVLSPLQRRYAGAAKEIRAIIVDLLARSVHSPGGKDLLSLIRNATDPADGSPMSEKQLIDELVNLMIAGTETTGGALAWTLCELARRPEVEARVCEERDRVVGSRAVEFADVAALEYTGRVLSEVLRQRAAWLSTRRSLRPLTLGGRRIPSGTEFAFSLYAMHHDPAVYPRPDVFDTDRWLPEVVAARPRGAFMPFLDGNRKCLGHSFAWTELVVAVATILGRWRLRLTPGTRVREVPLATVRPSRLIAVPLPR